MSIHDEVREALHSAAPLNAAIECVLTGEPLESALARATQAEVGCLHLVVQQHPCGVGRCGTCGSDVEPAPEPRPVTLPICDRDGCDASEDHFHRLDDGYTVPWHAGHVHWDGCLDPGDPDYSGCYAPKPATTTDLHTIDCKGIDPSVVQSFIDALTDGIAEGKGAGAMSVYPQPIAFEDIRPGMDVQTTCAQGGVTATRRGIAHHADSDTIWTAEHGWIGTVHDDWQLMAPPPDPDAELIERMVAEYWKPLTEQELTPTTPGRTVMERAWHASMRRVLGIVREHDASGDHG